MATKRFLISRADNIGDVVLTLPMTALLKKYFPGCDVDFLARDYVKAVLDACTDVDQFISWESLTSLSDEDAVNYLRKGNYSVFIALFPTKNWRLMRLVKKAGIPLRIGVLRRPEHILSYNKWIYFSRSRSGLHEAQLNCKLLEPLGIKQKFSCEELQEYFTLKPTVTEKIVALKDNARFNLVLHPGSNGHGREWPASYYVELIRSLPADKVKIFITGSASEGEKFADSLLANVELLVTNLMGKLALSELLALLANSDGMIASGTGPVHLAAAVGINTLGLYPPQPVVGPQRWHPIGSKSEYLVNGPSCSVAKCSNTDCACMRAISVQKVVTRVLSWL